MIMNEKSKRVWFPAKKYGWGWGFPCAWQGWVVFLAYIGLAIATSCIIDSTPRLLMWIGLLFVLSVLFVLICLWKGEKPAWRWGDKK
jgi:phosphoglycerol transferase MdoB-like AlkP superfamily enzyme